VAGDDGTAQGSPIAGGGDDQGSLGGGVPQGVLERALVVKGRNKGGADIEKAGTRVDTVDNGGGGFFGSGGCDTRWLVVEDWPGNYGAIGADGGNTGSTTPEKQAGDSRAVVYGGEIGSRRTAGMNHADAAAVKIRKGGDDRAVNQADDDIGTAASLV
jgi:hypothetical protein